MVSFSPRLNVSFLSQVVGRSAELRLQDLWLLFTLFVAIALAANSRQVLQSPWHPWFLGSLSVLLVISFLSLVTSSTFALSQLGYAARFFQFFFFVFTIAVLRFRAGPIGDVFVLASLCLGFLANALNTFAMQLQGKSASYSSSTLDFSSVFYGPSMLFEPNSLSSGLYFVAGSAFFSALYLTKRINPAVFIALEVSIAAILLAVGDRASLVAFIGVSLFTVSFKYRAKFVLLSGLLCVGLWFIVARLADMGVGYWRFQSRYLWESAGARSSIWRDNLGQVIERPLLGWGPGGASAANNFVGISEPHNAFIRMLQEYGLLGTIAFGILVIVILKREPLGNSLRVPSAEHLPFQFIWAFTLKAYLVALLVAGVLTDSLTTITSWHLLAIFTGLAWGSTSSQFFPSPKLVAED
jgi:O-antigen ligase